MKAKRTNKRKRSIEDRLENLEYLVEKLKQKGEKYELVYVASGGQHVDTIQTQNVYTTKSREEKSETSSPYVSNKTSVWFFSIFSSFVYLFAFYKFFAPKLSDLGATDKPCGVCTVANPKTCC